MKFPSVNVDADTYDVISSYVLDVKEYYECCLSEKEKEISDLQAKIRGLELYCTAYKNRISGLDLFLDGLHILELPFSDG